VRCRWSLIDLSVTPRLRASNEHFKHLFEEVVDFVRTPVLDIVQTFYRTRVRGTATRRITMTALTAIPGHVATPWGPRRPAPRGSRHLVSVPTGPDVAARPASRVRLTRR